MSGGVAAYGSVLDKRMAAVMLQVPFTSSSALVDAIPEIMPQVYADLANIKAGGKAGIFELFARDPTDAKSGFSKAFNKDPALIPFIEILEQRKIHWAGDVATQSLPYLLNFEPLALFSRIAPAPLLIVAADSDHTSPFKSQCEAFEVALEPKQLVVLEGCDHFMPYYGQTFEKNIEVQIDFLRQTFG
jgi:pimeloyl-ACP methyl ester carboxylesterase